VHVVVVVVVVVVVMVVAFFVWCVRVQCAGPVVEAQCV
jgi:hypothetical protein